MPSESLSEAADKVAIALPPGRRADLARASAFWKGWGMYLSIALGTLAALVAAAVAGHFVYLGLRERNGATPKRML